MKIRILKFAKERINRRSTRISPLAILNCVNYSDHVGVKAFAKLERVEIGRCSYIGSMAAAYDCKIGSFCSIARNVYIGGGIHPLEWVSTSPVFHIKDNITNLYYGNKTFQWSKETIIENDVWIGIRAIVLPGLKISTGAVIGAGSVVTHDVGPYEIWAGNPARLIRKRFDDETIEKLLGTKWWEWDDEKIEKYSSVIDEPNCFLDLFLKENNCVVEK